MRSSNISRAIPADSLRTRAFERILLIKPSSLGDVVHALPVLSGLRQRYPQAHIAWLIGKSFAPLLRGHPAIDELIDFDRKRFGRLGRNLGATVEFFRFVRELRERRFGLVIDLQGLFRSGYFAWKTQAPVRIGFGDAREFAPMFYTHKLPPRTNDMHAVDRNLGVASMLGFADAPPLFDLAIRDEERAEASTLLAEVGIAADQPFVAVMPGARWETKQWPVERFAPVIDQVFDATGIHSVLLGGGDEVAACATIAAACRSQPASLAGRTSLRLLSAIIERAASVLCHDSGPLHLAAALDRPLVCLTGPTNPARTGPYRRKDTVLRLDLPCSPCYLRRLSQCRFQHECMQKLSADSVSGMLIRSLEPKPANADT